MSFNKLVTMAFTASLLSGCGTMVAKLATSATETSTYNPLSITEDEVNDYFYLIEKSEGREVSDELGSYFYKKEKEGVFSRFSLLNEDGGFLKSSLSKTVGLMEPVYSYDRNYEPQINWEETKKTYRFFTKTIGLKLLPLKHTRQYNDELNNAAKGRAKAQMQATSSGMVGILASSAKVFSSAVSGEFGLYSPEYYNNILSKVINNATYLISFSGSLEYYNNSFGKTFRSSSSNAHRSSTEKKGASYYAGLARKLEGFNHLSFNFIPVSYFKNLKSGGAYRYYSGCKVESRQFLIDVINYTNETSSVPYYSAIKHVIKDKKQNNIEIEKERFYTALKQVPKNRRLVENACKFGFKEMGLSGKIESKKLL